MADQLLLSEVLVGHFYLRLATEDLSDHFLNLRILRLEFPLALPAFVSRNNAQVRLEDPARHGDTLQPCLRFCAKECLDDCDGLPCVVENRG